MRKNTFIAKEHIAALNEFKKCHTQLDNFLLNEEILRNVFKACNIPSNPLFLSELRKFGLLIRVKSNTYVWKDRKPIHYQALQNIYLNYKKKLSKYLNTYHIKRKEEKIKEITKAIIFLESCELSVIIPNKKFKLSSK